MDWEEFKRNDVVMSIELCTDAADEADTDTALNLAITTSILTHLESKLAHQDDKRGMFAVISYYISCSAEKPL